MAKVFISFAHEDRSVAEAVKSLIEHELTLQGQVFMVTDQTQLKAGQDWLARIKEEITSADVVVLMLSKRSIHQPWINFEAGAAWILGKPAIPACFGKQQKGQLPNPYSHWQGLNLPDDEPYLLNSIADHLGIEQPRVLDKMLKILDLKKLTPIEKFLEMTRDVRLALANWQDE